MDAGSPGVLRFLLILMVFSAPLVLVHELGHAVVALACSREPVLVTVGKRPGWLRGRVGRLRFELSPLRSARGEPAGFAQTAARLAPRVRLAFALGGPAASIAFGALLLVGSPASGARVAGALVSTALVSMFVGVLNLVPKQVGRHRNDG